MPCEKRWGLLFIYEPLYTDFFAVILSLQPKTNDENSFRAAGPVTIFTRPRLVTDLTSGTNLATALEQTKVRAKAAPMRFFRQLGELSSSWQLRSTGNSMPSSKSHLAEQKEPVLHQGDQRCIGFMSCKNILKFFFLNLPSFFQTCRQQYQSLRPGAIPITIEMLQDSCWTGNWCNHHWLCKAGLIIVTMSSRSSKTI